jgi:hypothetical protein
MMASPKERGNWIDDGTGIGNPTIDYDLLRWETLRCD